MRKYHHHSILFDRISSTEYSDLRWHWCVYLLRTSSTITVERWPFQRYTTIDALLSASRSFSIIITSIISVNIIIVVIIVWSLIVWDWLSWPDGVDPWNLHHLDLLVWRLWSNNREYLFVLYKWFTHYSDLISDICWVIGNLFHVLYSSIHS